MSRTQARKGQKATDVIASLEKRGVTPDVIVLPTPEDVANSRDPALAKAAELVGVKIDSTAAGKMFPFEWIPLS